MLSASRFSGFGCDRTHLIQQWCFFFFFFLIMFLLSCFELHMAVQKSGSSIMTDRLQPI